MGSPSIRLRAAFGSFSVVVALTGACAGGDKKAKSPTGGSTPRPGPAEVGKPAPDLSVQTLNGKGKITLDSLQGKIAVIDFWATWCGPCEQSFPKLEELSKRNQGKVEFVAVSVDDKSDNVADWAKEHGATFAIAWDDGHAIAKRWKVGSMPTTFVLDTTGTVRFIHAGYHDKEADEINKEIATLVGEKPKDKDNKDGDKPKNEVASTDPPPAKTAEPPPDPPPAEDPPPAKPPGKKGSGKKPPGKKPPGKAPPKKKPAAAPGQ